MLKSIEAKRVLDRLTWAGALISGFVITDLLFSFFCSRWSLLFYLIAGGVGVWKAESLQKRFSKDSWFSKLVRRFAILLALISVLGLVILFAAPVRWDTKCSWRYCGRAMGPGLLKSPFPVGNPACRGWMKCANEYQYSASDYEKLLRRMEKQGCPAP